MSIFGTQKSRPYFKWNKKWCSLANDSSHLSADITASVTSWVVLLPPRSLVRYFPSKITCFTAVSKRFAKSGSCTCLSIMADERSRAIGFALFFSTIFGFPTFPADAPCSKIAYSVPTLPKRIDQYYFMRTIWLGQVGPTSKYLSNSFFKNILITNVLNMIAKTILLQ